MLKNPYEHIRVCSVTLSDECGGVFVANSRGNLAMKIKNPLTFKKQLFNCLDGRNKIQS